MTMRQARTSPLSALLAAGLVALAACGNGGQDPRDVVRIDPATAAVVDGEPVFVADVELEALSQGLIRAGEDFGSEHPDFGRVLDQLIDQRLLAQEALRRGLDQDDQARHRLEIARERILGNLLVENLLASQVTEEAIRQMYNEQVRLQQLGDEVRLARILTETEPEAKDIAKKIAAGEEFATLAFQYSRDLATRAEGGELGWVGVDSLADPYVGAVGNTAVGSVSEPFQTEEGWVLLRVQERRKQAPRTLEEMRPDIVRFLTLSQINLILRELRTSAEVQRMPTPGTDAALADANRELPAPAEPKTETPGQTE